MSTRHAFQSLASLRHRYLSSSLPTQSCKPQQQQTRGIRLAALRAKRLSDSVRPPARPKVKSGHPKRDPTTYGIPRLAEGEQVVPRRPAKIDDVPAYANHPLWAFFHHRRSIELSNLSADAAGRSWRAPELRTKSFEELHQLWYILLRERNVLYTQLQELRHLKVPEQFTSSRLKIHRCRKGMARIKYVLSERRHAAIEAGHILAQRRAAEGTKAQPEPVLVMGENDRPARPHPSIHGPPTNAQHWGKVKREHAASRRIRKKQAIRSRARQGTLVDLMAQASLNEAVSRLEQ